MPQAGFTFVFRALWNAERCSNEPSIVAVRILRWQMTQGRDGSHCTVAFMDKSLPKR